MIGLSGHKWSGTVRLLTGPGRTPIIRETSPLLWLVSVRSDEATPSFWAGIVSGEGAAYRLVVPSMTQDTRAASPASVVFALGPECLLNLLP